MTSVGIGPEINRPSWNWVGFDTARELSKYFDIKVFKYTDTPPKCDVLLIVKQLPGMHFMQEAKRNNSKIIYCPIDFFTSLRHVNNFGVSLSMCDTVLVHCDMLIPVIAKYCTNVHPIDHHNKYGLGTMNQYKKDGPIIWIGACEHLPYLLKWLETNPLKHKLVIMTNHLDVPRGPSVDAAHNLANDLGLTLELHPNEINGHRAYPWYERGQFELLKMARAAIDIKGDDFCQSYKPPTKAQKYIVSGIPFATNVNNHAHRYFDARGFKIALPEDVDRWLSYDYWAETVQMGVQMYVDTTLEAIGLRYKNFIQSLISANADQ